MHEDDAWLHPIVLDTAVTSAAFHLRVALFDEPAPRWVAWRT